MRMTGRELAMVDRLDSIVNRLAMWLKAGEKHRGSLGLGDRIANRRRTSVVGDELCPPRGKEARVTWQVIWVVVVVSVGRL